MFEFEEFHTRLLPETADEMVWHIGDHGFALQLSSIVPRHLERAAPGVLQQLFAGSRPQFWAIQGLKFSTLPRWPRSPTITACR